MKERELKKHILLTGDKGIGKSTLVKSFLGSSRCLASGFYTKVVSDSLNGVRTIIMSTVDGSESATVGYSDGIKRTGLSDAFDSFGVLCLSSHKDIIIMDELGVLEKDACLFQKRVLEVLEGDCPVLAVIKKNCDYEFINKVRAHRDASLIEVTEHNRDELLKSLILWSHSHS